MKLTADGLAKNYREALRACLKRGAQANSGSAQGLGDQAVALGIDILALARIHESGLAGLGLDSRAQRPNRPAERFFAEALVPMLAAHRITRKSGQELLRVQALLDRRTSELVIANASLRTSVARRKDVDAVLRKSAETQSRLLRESLQQQEGLRQLTRQLLVEQEDKRLKISRELQDSIVQTLLGINLRLISLRKLDRNNTEGMHKLIASTQRLVVASMRSVGRMAREFGGI